MTHSPEALANTRRNPLASARFCTLLVTSAAFLAWLITLATQPGMRPPLLMVASAAPQTPPGEPTLLGVWEDDFHGHRKFDFRPDGTGTMELELDGAGKLLYGGHIEFEFHWVQAGTELNLTLVTGRPAGSVEILARLFGREFHYQLEDLANETCTLISKNETSSVLRRPADVTVALPTDRATELR